MKTAVFAAMIVPLLFNTSMDVQPDHSGTSSPLPMQHTYCLCAAKSLPHTADTIISTFSFYIKNLLGARQTKI